MAKYVVEVMLPGEDGKVNKASLWEGTTKKHILHIIHSLHILHILHTVYIIYIFYSEKDSDQLVDFYRIDLLLSAERIVGRTKYAKKTLPAIQA
jgi:hypothetical protein